MMWYPKGHRPCKLYKTTHMHIFKVWHFGKPKFVYVDQYDNIVGPHDTWREAFEGFKSICSFAHSLFR